MADRKRASSHAGQKKMNQVTLTSASSEDSVAACFLAVSIQSHGKYIVFSQLSCQYNTLCLIAMETAKKENKLCHTVETGGSSTVKDSVCTRTDHIVGM